MEIIHYGQHEDQFIEVHVPSKVNSPNQWLVLVHGGYWRDKYNLSLSDPLIELLLNKGFKVVNIEYRRGHHPWPIPEEDVKKAIQFFKDSTFFKGEEIILIGHSVGGQLALNNASQAERIIALAPVTDVLYTKEHHLGNEAVKDYFGDAPDSLLKEASPLSRLPLKTKTLMIHGFNDEQVKIETTFKYIEKNNKNNIDLYAYAVFPHMDCIDPEGKHIDVMINWIKKHK
ncbi:alpha/beta hydrolase family protein [Dolosicoccus paucivorans]|uniref:Alpha/beta hydrolase n=1 Tax=Dolosicoccus paucivorans TaxID=84521 RepID=A0A1G8N327_9LACT|nr:alpha/beta hydrolase [Dolosicoccus paucivorans]PMB84361.1 alpha/beta hydrolase [Dolosicoccus paucivorans]PMC58110.1 alpha/beta hydrolase [Dolosicoccus paucivorans]SDI74447.1 Alpha/beta hydrolase family protein [Dolosicoccus paucivorans]